MCKSDFKAAASWYEKALSIRKKYDDKFSRVIAEIYFNLASVCDFDANKCLLSYYKTKIILEYHLKEGLKKNGMESLADTIIINESDLDVEQTPKKQSIKFFKEAVENKTGENIPEAVSELADVVSQVYQKV